MTAFLNHPSPEFTPTEPLASRDIWSGIFLSGDYPCGPACPREERDASRPSNRTFRPIGRDTDIEQSKAYRARETSEGSHRARVLSWPQTSHAHSASGPRTGTLEIRGKPLGEAEGGSFPRRV